MNAIPCPPESTLRSLILGLLAEEDCVVLENHIRGCRHCELAIEGFDADKDSLIGQLNRIPPISGNPNSGNPGSTNRTDESVDVLQHALEAVGLRQVFISDEASERDPQAHGTGSTDSRPAIIGDYEILATLGRGGMGVVYLARHRPLGRQVALKVLSERRWQDDSAVARFTREMKIVGKMQHPAMISATDAGKSNGVHYLVMELVDGLDLRLVSKRLGPFAPDRIGDACELIRQAALGMQYAHEQGIVHRDAKPSNLMLDATGKIKVLDLGLATIKGFEGTIDKLTTMGQLLGTLDFMAPEQCEGLANGEVASDIYGLGATLYKVLSGQPPYGTSDSSPLARLRHMATMEPPSIGERVPELDLKLVAIIDRCLNRNPDERHSSAADLAAKLEPFCRDHDLVLVLDQARKLAGPDEERPSQSEIDREFQSAASDIRKFRKQLQTKQNWRLAITVGSVMLSLGLLAVLAFNYFPSSNPTGRNTAGPSPDINGQPEHDSVFAQKENAPAKSIQESKATLVINAPFMGVRLQLLLDDKVVKEWTTQSKTESINVPPGEYSLRQLTHTKRLALSASRIQLKSNALQLISLNRPVEKNSYVETQIVFDVEGIGKEELDYFRRRLKIGQSKTVLTSDEQSLVIIGPKNTLDFTSMYRDNISVRANTGMTVGASGGKTNSFASFKSIYINTLVARDSNLTESHQLTIINRSSPMGPDVFRRGLIKTKTIGVPGWVKSIAVKKNQLLITCEKPVGDRQEGRSQLIVAECDLGKVIQRFNFADAPFTVYASNADNSYFYRVIEEYGKAIRLQQFDLTSSKRINETRLHECAGRINRNFIGISADGSKLLFEVGRYQSPYLCECDFIESTMSFSPLRRIEDRDRHRLASKYGRPARMEQASVALPLTFDPEIRACIATGSLAIHPTKDIVGILGRDGLTLRRLSDQEELLNIKRGKKWNWNKIAWSNRGNELAVMYDNRVRLFDMSKLVAGHPDRIESEPVQLPVNAVVGQEWKMKFNTDVRTDLPDSTRLQDRSYELIEGPAGMTIRDNVLAWKADGTNLEANKVVVEVTGQIVSTKRPGRPKPSDAKGRIEFEISALRPFFPVDGKLQLTQVSDDGKYILLTERERRRATHDRNSRMTVVSANTGETLAESTFDRDVVKFVFVQDYLFTFFREHDHAMRFDLIDGDAKTFPLDLGSDLNTTRTKTGVPFEERNAPNSPSPPEHLSPWEVVASGDELELYYQHGYWLSEWPNVLSVCDILDIHDLEIKKQRRVVGPQIQVESANSPLGYRQYGSRMFEVTTGKLVHNFASHWLPPLTFDEARIKSLSSYAGTFAKKPLGITQIRKPAPEPKIVRKDSLVSLDWNGVSTPIVKDKFFRTGWGGSCIGNDNVAVCKLQQDCFYVIQYSNLKVTDNAVARRRITENGKGWHEVWDFNVNPLIVSTDSIVRLKPATKKEIGQIEIELVDADRNVRLDGNEIVVDTPEILSEFLQVCRDRKLSYSNREFLRRSDGNMKSFLAVFDDAVWFKEITGQTLPAESLAFQYPVRYRLNIPASDQRDAIEETIHTNLILIVPRRVLDFLPRHKTMKSK